MPTFDVEVKLPPYATYNKSDVLATIKATYTYGKPVKGEVTLTVQSQNRLEQFQTKTQIDGSIDIPVDIVRDLNLDRTFTRNTIENEIEFSALVEEGLTGRKYSKSNTVKIYDKEIKVELIKTSKTFKPGLKFTSYLKVAYQDDLPVDDNGSPLILNCAYDHGTKMLTENLNLIPERGMIKFEIFPPKDAFLIAINAEYRGQHYYVRDGVVKGAQSPSNNFIQIIMSDQRSLHIGQEIEFEVNATEGIDKLIYEVMGREDIVLARGIEMANTSTTKFRLMTTHQMAPKSRIIVYYVRSDNKEVVADALNFDVEGVFKTPVAIDTDVRETKPGAHVQVKVSTMPQAYVGILGIDQSVLLLKSGNDITQQDVINELESYDSARFKWSSQWSSWPRLSTTGEIFDHSGIVILSNGMIGRINNDYDYFDFNCENCEGVEDAGMISTLSNDKIDSRSGKSNDIADMTLSNHNSGTNKIRKFFPETWLWESLIVR